MIDIFTAAQLAEVRAYHHPKYVMAALGDGVALAQLAFLCAITPWLYRICEGRAKGCATEEALPGKELPSRLLRLPGVLWGGAGWIPAVRFCLAFTVLGALLQLPERVYFGYVLEHRFALSHQTFGHFIWMNLKGTLAAAAVTAMLGFGLFGLIRRTRHWWWSLGLVAGCGMLISATLDPYRNALYYKQSDLPAGPLRSRLEKLLERAEVPYSRIVVEQTSLTTDKVDAYFAGQGPTRSIVLEDSLVKHLTPDEVAAAVAHEAGHVHERRWLGRIGAALGVFAFFFLLQKVFAVGSQRHWLGAVSPGDVRLFPVMCAVFFLASLLGAPVSAYFDRQRESEADRYAVRLTGDPRSFQQMLVKVARINKMDPYPPRWVTWMGARHPPVGQRIDDVKF